MAGQSRAEQSRAEQSRAEDCSGSRFECQSSGCNSGGQLYNGKREPWNKQHPEHRKWCCYGNYKKVFKINVEIAMAVLARDYKGFGSGLIPSNMVIEIL